MAETMFTVEAQHHPFIGGPKCAIVRDVETESSETYELSNVVETALAKALVLAAEAKRWNVVLQIADELQRRGLAPTRRTYALELI